jgi:hypothetical protein
MGINFPASPLVGDKYPTPAQAGIPQYTWDGTIWRAQTPPSTFVKLAGDTMTGDLTLPRNATSALHAVPKQQLDARVADAMAYSGMQINGSMDVSQENGATGVLLTGVQTKFVLDGWTGIADLATGTAAVGQATFSATDAYGFKQCLQVVPNVAQASIGASYVRLMHKIEGYRIMRLAWGTSAAQPITIGFWARAAFAGTYRLLIQNFDGSVTSSWFPFVLAGGATFQWVTVTIPAQTTGTWKTDNTVGLQILIETSSSGTANNMASGGYFSLTGVVVLPGIYAPTAAQSPLIMRPYDQELLTCQRYYQQWGGESAFEIFANGQCSSSTAAQFFRELVPTMRSLPTLGLAGTLLGLHTSGTSVVTLTGLVLGAGASSKGVVLNGTIASAVLVTGDATKLLANNDIAARVKLDARL